LTWIEDLRWVVNASLSADAGVAAAAIAWRDGEGERRAIRVVDVERGAIVATVDSGSVDDLPAFSPQGRGLAFVSDRDGGVPQLMLLTESEEKPRRLTAEPGGVVSYPLWSPDGAFVAISVRSGPVPQPGPRRITRALWRGDGLGEIDEVITAVLVIEAAPPHRSWHLGGQLQGILRPLDWRGSGTVLVAASYRPEAAPGDLREQLFELDLDGEIRERSRPRGAGIVACCLPDDGLLYTHHVDLEGGWGRSSSLRFLDADGTETQVAAGEFPFELVGDIDDDAVGDFLRSVRHLPLQGDAAIVRGQEGGVLGAYRVPLDEPRRAEPVLVEPRRSNYPLELRGRHLLLAGASLDEPASISVLDLESGQIKPVDPLRDDERVDFLPLSVIRGDDPCEHWMISPPGDPDGPHPTVLFVHGGPFCALGETFTPSIRLLTDAGFAVLIANPVGSRGHGDAFGEAVKGDWGGRDADQLIEVVDRAVAAGVADPTRLGIAGASYGGYMACLMVGRTRRFAAAVAEDPVTDLVAATGTMDVGPLFFPGYFGDDDDLMRAVSPITYAGESVTPTLLILGEEDRRCDPSQGYSFYSALRRAGCAAEMLLLPGADHWGKVTGPMSGRRAQEEALVEWFDRHLNGASVPAA
jgi:dipeptidyl aminopeptidase/acylaminoacyl peptidase